jgi:Tol biopolymer transport system component
MHGRRTVATAAATIIALTLGGSAAHAGSAGETFPLLGLPLPAGGLAGGAAGFGNDGSADRIAVSDDGRYVAFVATSDTLAPGAQPDTANVFRKDRLTGEATLVSRASGDGPGPVQDSLRPAISDDGAKVAFLTTATLDPADTDGGAQDVYVRDMTTGQTTLATGGVNGSISEFALSGDGNWIAFATIARLQPGDTNSFTDVYRRRLSDGMTTLASHAAGAVTAGDGFSGAPAISDDGRWVAFTSGARNLVSGYASGSGQTNVFAIDMQQSLAYVVSAQFNGAAKGANANSYAPAIAGAPDGDPAHVVIAYETNATNVTAEVDNATSSVYRRRLSVTASTLVSRGDGAAGANADAKAEEPSISDDGSRVSFFSTAGNLGAPGPGPLGGGGVYVRDPDAGRTAVGSPSQRGASEGALSGDGSLLTWVDAGAESAGGDPDLAAVLARPVAPSGQLGAVELVSRPAGAAPYLGTAVETLEQASGRRVTSADGRYVVFVAHSGRLPSGDVHALRTYRRDLLTGATELVSRADGADGAPVPYYSYGPTISADGTRVAYVAYDGPDVNAPGRPVLYVRDLVHATTTIASRADGPSGAIADGSVSAPAISADGQQVLFLSSSSLLGPADGRAHLYRRDLASGRTQLVDRAGGASGPIADDDAGDGALSADGSRVVFTSLAGNLDPADAGARHGLDVYVRDIAAQTTTLVSRRSGLAGAKASGSSSEGVISADGRTVAFVTSDEAVAPEAGTWGGHGQVVARDLTTGANTLVSRVPGGPSADGSSFGPAISGDGATVAFTSEAANLLPGVGGVQHQAVFVRRADGTLAGPPAFGPDPAQGGPPSAGAAGVSISDDGQCLVFTALGHNAATGPAGDLRTLYGYVVSGSCPKRPADPPGGGGGGGGRTGGSSAKPALSRVSLLHARFRVGKGATAVTAAAKRRKAKPAPAGTAVRFTLSARANVSVAIERKAAGRKVGRQCRRATRRLRRRPVCVRWEKAGTLVRKGVDPGRRSVAFSGRIGRRALKPGSYRAVVTAANAAGSSRPATLAFTVVRR